MRASLQEKANKFNRYDNKKSKKKMYAENVGDHFLPCPPLAHPPTLTHHRLRRSSTASSPIHTYNQISTRALSVKFHFSVLYSFNMADFNAFANLKR
jgi:hypothetical protein